MSAINYSFAQAIEILPKINAFNQYYLGYESRNLFILLRDVVVMLFIPPPNSSSSFEVSAIFWDCNFDDFFVCAVDAVCSV